MISFFESQNHSIFAVQTDQTISKDEIKKLEWLLGNANLLSDVKIKKEFIGPRAAMISPWSTNAVEICKNMGLDSILRIEKYIESKNSTNDIDPMLNEKFESLSQSLFKINLDPKKITSISNIQDYNEREGLSLSDDEVDYLNNLSLIHI